MIFRLARKNFSNCRARGKNIFACRATALLPRARSLAQGVREGCVGSCTTRKTCVQEASRWPAARVLRAALVRGANRARLKNAAVFSANFAIGLCAGVRRACAQRLAVAARAAREHTTCKRLHARRESVLAPRCASACSAGHALAQRAIALDDSRLSKKICTETCCKVFGNAYNYRPRSSKSFVLSARHTGCRSTQHPVPTGATACGKWRCPRSASVCSPA